MSRGCSEPQFVSLRDVVAKKELFILHQAVEADVVQLQIEFLDSLTDDNACKL